MYCHNFSPNKRVQHIFLMMCLLLTHNTARAAMFPTEDQDYIQYCATLMPFDTPLNLKEYVSNNSIASDDQPQNAFQADLFMPPNDLLPPSNNLMCITSHYSKFVYSPAPDWCTHILKNDGIFFPYFLTEEALQKLQKQEHGIVSPEISTWQRFCEQRENSTEEDDDVIDLKKNAEEKQKSKVRAKKTTAKYKGRRHQCMQCSKKFPTPKALTLHVRIHTKEKTDQCPECDKLFNQYCNLKRHVYKHVVKQNPDQDLLPHRCSECNYAALQSHSIKEHLKHQHNVPEDEVDYMIIHDNKKKAELNDLTKKLLEKKYISKNDEPQEANKVPVPKKQNRKYNSFKRSVSCQKPNIIMQLPQVSLTLKKYICCICEEKLASKDALQHHVKNIHLQLRPYFCPHCSHAGIKAWVLQRHLKQQHHIMAGKDTVEMDYYNPDKAQPLLQKAQIFFKQISSS